VSRELKFALVLLCSSMSCYFWAVVIGFFSTRPDAFNTLMDALRARIDAQINKFPSPNRELLFDELREKCRRGPVAATTLRLVAILFAIIATGELGAAVWIWVHHR
jgi:hypothetical protein